MNTNWLQEFDIPIGPDNTIEPGGPDQGQPTHFYPRRNPFLFTIRVPKDFGNKELIWTLTANGKTEQAYASLKTDYQIDKQVISTEVGGDIGSLARRASHQHAARPQGRRRRSAATVKVGRAADAGGARQRSRQPAGPPRRQAAAGREESRGAPRQRRRPTPQPPSTAAVGLPAAVVVVAVERTGPAVVVDRLSRQGRRGRPSRPDQMKTWMDTRAYAQLAVVAAVRHSRAAAGRQVDGAGDVPASRAPTCCAPSPATAALFTYENVHRHRVPARDDTGTTKTRRRRERREEDTFSLFVLLRVFVSSWSPSRGARGRFAAGKAVFKGSGACLG